MNSVTKISAFSVIILFVIFSILGLSLLYKIPLSLNPTQSLPSATISFTWPGATPRIIETEVTSKLEAVFSSVSGVVHIESYTQNNYSQIVVSFDKYVNFEYARFELSMLIRQLYPKFPPQVNYPQITMNLPDEDFVQPIKTYSLVGAADPWILQKYAEEFIRPQLTVIKGIEAVSIYGALPFEWEILYNHHRLDILHITESDLINALNIYLDKENIGFCTDSVSGKLTNSFVIMQNADKTINWDNICVKNSENRIIRLPDVAQIRLKQQQPYSYYRINGLNFIYIVIDAEQNANQLVLAANLDKLMPELKAKLPAGYAIKQNTDSTTFIRNELNTILIRSLYTFLILFGFIFLVSRSLRYLILIGVTLIANLSIAILFYAVFKVSFHLFSFAGVTISLGLIMDNAIVMIEYLRFKKGIKVFLPVLASTLTTIGALVIIFFLDEKIRITLIDFTKVIIINLTVSLFCALFLVPALANYIRIYKAQRILKRGFRTIFIKNFTTFYLKFISFAGKRKWLVISMFILLFGLPVYKLPANITGNGWAVKMYNSIFGSLVYTDYLKPVLDKSLGGTLRLFDYYVYENSYYTTAKQKTELIVIANMVQGATIEQLNDAFITLESYLASFSQINTFVTEITGDVSGVIRISFSSENERNGFPYQLKSKIIARVIDLDAINWNIYGIGQGFDNYKGESVPHYKIPVYGYNYDELNTIVNNLGKKLVEHPRVPSYSVNSYRSIYSQKLPDFEFVFTLNKKQLALYNLTPIQVFNALQNFSVKKYPQIQTILNGQTLYFTFRNTLASDADLWNLNNLPVKIDNNVYKLKYLGEITKQRTNENIYKVNQQYKRFVEFDYTGTEKFGLKYVNKVIEGFQTIIPVGYFIEPPDAHYFYLLQDNQTMQYWLLLVVIAIIYLICVVLLESFYQPILVLLTIPVSFIGVFLTFYWFNLNFDMGGFASLILLSGLSVNSALYIINEYNNLRTKRHNISQLKTFVKAFHYKIIPILITVLSTSLGLIPFIAGGQHEVFWFALAAGTIGGSVFSLMAIFMLLPILIIRR